MLYILTSHIDGRLASPLRQFLPHAIPGKDYALITPYRLPEFKRTDVIVGLTPPAKNGLKKLRLDDVTIMQAIKFGPRLKSILGPPGPLDEIRGTFWRSEKQNGAMCCISWHPKAGLYVYRTLTARWLGIASAMAEAGKAEGPSAMDAMIHQWRSEAGTDANVEERLNRSKGLVAYDIETNWDGEKADRITYFSIGDEFGSCSWHWTPTVQRAVTKWLSTPAGPRVLQNYVFDIPWLMKICGLKDVVGPLHDTMALRSELCRQWPMGLQDIGAQMLVVEPWKSSYRAGVMDEQLYSARDSEITYEVAQKLFALMPSLRDAGMKGYWE